MARKKFRKRPPKEMGEKRKKARDLAKKYGMDELVALEIVSGVLPLEEWKDRQDNKERQNLIRQQLEKRVAEFSCTADFSLPLAADVLKGTLSLWEYRQQKFDRLKIESKASQLVQQHTIPMAVARLIAADKFTLEEYQENEKKKAERRKKAQEMREKHQDLAIETCYQIIDENISVEEYLGKREQGKQKRGNWYRNYLKDRFQDNKFLNMYLGKLRKNRVPMAFFLFGLQSLYGIVLEYTPYQIKIKDPHGVEHIIPKLKIKYMSRVAYMEKVLPLVEIDKKLQENSLSPKKNPYERYRFPPRSPYQGQKMRVTLGEGEQITGKVKWFSKYDLKLTTSFSPKTTVMIFRHAIVQVDIL